MDKKLNETPQIGAQLVVRVLEAVALGGAALGYRGLNCAPFREGPFNLRGWWLSLFRNGTRNRGTTPIESCAHDLD